MGGYYNPYTSAGFSAAHMAAAAAAAAAQQTGQVTIQTIQARKIPPPKSISNGNQNLWPKYSFLNIIIGGHLACNSAVFADLYILWNGKYRNMLLLLVWNMFWLWSNGDENGGERDENSLGQPRKLCRRTFAASHPPPE